MGKRIRKILFGDLFNIEEYEEYFSEMSREGLHLQKIGRYFAYFEEGEPSYLNYRIDIVKKDEKEIKIRQYKRKGWSFVSEKDSFLIFSSPENSGFHKILWWNSFLRGHNRGSIRKTGHLIIMNGSWKYEIIYSY